jgi:hypothetical protein
MDYFRILGGLGCKDGMKMTLNLDQCRKLPVRSFPGGGGVRVESGPIHRIHVYAQLLIVTNSNPSLGIYHTRSRPISIVQFSPHLRLVMHNLIVREVVGSSSAPVAPGIFAQSFHSLP